VSAALIMFWRDLHTFAVSIADDIGAPFSQRSNIGSRALSSRAMALTINKGGIPSAWSLCSIN